MVPIPGRVCQLRTRLLAQACLNWWYSVENVLQARREITGTPGDFSAAVPAAIARAETRRGFSRCFSKSPGHGASPEHDPSLGMLGGVQDLPASLAYVREKVGHVS